MTDTPLNILMIASENDAIPGAKVGGIGDVVRDLPRALSALGHNVHVVIPAYGQLHKLPGATKTCSFPVRFRQQQESVDLYSWRDNPQGKVHYWLTEHELFSNGGAGKIYCDDPDWAPFESDANKFALFCQACAEAIHQNLFGELDVVHLHDWHAAFYVLLREYDSRYLSQKQLRCVFTLHNLALQGIRPLAGNASSLNNWYPWLPYDPGTVADPRWQECINPLASAIRLCDKTHTVSPSYAQEIQQANALESRGFHGGEGLEQLLEQTAENGKLEGILNGCMYTDLVEGKPPAAIDWKSLVEMLSAANQRWIVQNTSLQTTDYLADRALQNWQAAEHPIHIITSIGRLTGQKVSLLLQQLDDGISALESMLTQLGNDGVFVLLGTGDPAFEQFFTQVAAENANFLFLNHFDASVANLLYTSGTLFVMPSSYEPCGISQMIAMKHEQPCLVHSVGGLKDTVDDNVTGFKFNGNSLVEQASNLTRRFAECLAMATDDPAGWQKIRKAAGQQRFEWDKAANACVSQLYR